MHRSKRVLIFGDVHIPKHNPIALEIIMKVARLYKPDKIILLGDLLDCAQFSKHPPTWGEEETDYLDDLSTARLLLDRLQRYCKRLVIIEGNHEYRINRWAADNSEGKRTYSMLSPRLNLMKTSDGKPRRRCTYVPYGATTGKYPHYKLNSRVVCCHGWSYAKNAVKNHLAMSQGKSMVMGHTHRADVSIVQNVWKAGDVVQARSAGCMCKPIPTYGVGSPVEWINAFVLGFLGRASDTLYTIPIVNNQCILPDGRKVKARTQ